ncbi:MAG: UvrD-helicase domain-containing protein [Bacteroidaceae bacterium]|nr:UvrD-helicase domain-containing protein [Bacteroidaceae bacterium]
MKIFDRLSDLMQHSYWVGDYKQAIYGFRGSDITLTKAVVDRIATRVNGCDTETLDTSYRSLPGIVELCNETFKRTFKGVLDEGAIVLKTHRTNDEHIRSVRLWNMENPDSEGIASRIACLLKQDVKPSDIAVLGRTNAPLYALAGELTGIYGIPASRQDVTL